MATPQVLQVQVKSFKQALDTVLDHILRDLGVETVSIESDTDFYLDVGSKSLYDMSNQSPELDVGRLTDDWEFFSKIVDDREQGVALMLIHAAPLLRYMGEKIGR